MTLQSGNIFFLASDGWQAFLLAARKATRYVPTPQTALDPESDHVQLKVDTDNEGWGKPPDWTDFSANERQVV
jgi:hypothetical protein